MRHPQAVPDRVRVFDVVAVVEVVGDAVARGHAVEINARTDVAKIAVCDGRGAPVLPRAWKWVDGRVEGDQPVELAGVDGGELGLDPVFGVLRRDEISRHENSTFVCVIAVGKIPQSDPETSWVIITYPYIPGTFTKRPDSNILNG